MVHFPVLKKEVLKYLDPKPNENFVDCTFGCGGHTFSILKKIGPKGKILAIDWSPEIIENYKKKIEKLKGRIILVCDNFANLKKIVERTNFKPVSGILFDLGISSWHLAESGRGFTFQQDESLDMRYNTISNQLRAEEIVNSWGKEDIEKILKEYGEERFAKRIAKEIVRERKLKLIRTTFQLVEIVKKATPSWYHHKKIHFATKTFQGLRIAVNDELNNLKKALDQSSEILKLGGRLVIISFHSLEDRIVKKFFSEQSKNNLFQILTKKPVRPSLEEIKINPSSRSARLRAGKFCPTKN